MRQFNCPLRSYNAEGLLQRALEALAEGMGALSQGPADPLHVNAQARMLRKKAFLELRQRRPGEAQAALAAADACLADHPLHAAAASSQSQHS